MPSSDILTPVDLQGFLLQESNPLVAAEEIDDWIKNVRREHTDNEDGGRAN